MASYRPFPPPPQSNFAPPPLPNQPPCPPPPNSGQGNPYPQNWGYNGNDGSNYQHYNPASRNQRPPPLPNHQPQYAPPPPPPPDSSYPPPPPPSMQPPAPPMYYPSQQYSQFNHHHQQQPPPPPPPPLNPPPNSAVPPPPPPPSSPPPPPSSAPKDTKITPDKIKSREIKDEGASSKQRKPPPVPPVKKSNGPPGRAETEEERRIRKKREFEKQQHKQHLKDSQNKVLQKTQHLSSGIKAHGSVTGSQIGDKRNTHLLSGERIENRLKKPTTFLCKLKFRNELPDPTAQPKLLSLRRDKDRFTKYAITSLEKMHKPQLYVEPDLGIPLDLLDLSVYNPPKGKKLPLDPEDEELLRDDDAITPIKKDGIKRKERPEDIGMSWLVKTQYISPLSVESAKQSLTEKQAKELREARGGRTFVENSRKRQIQEIQASFEACKKLPVHATNRKLEPVEILPLIPDFERYKEQFVIATFDGAPTADSTTYGKLANNVRDACESQAIMKSFTATGSDAKSGKFLGYMVPNPNELSKDMYDENEDISYSWVREYNWDVCRYVRGDDADDPTTYLVSFGENEAHYMPLPTKLVLRKKRSREGKSVEEVEYFPAPKRITARRRSTVSARELKEDGEYSGSKSSMGRSGMEHEKDMDLDQYSEGDDYESENE